MMVMPGSPRPSSKEQDDGVYRSIFQQPLLEIPPAVPSYAWFEFLLHPEALLEHLQTLKRENAQGIHSTTSAIELVREFLDQAQLVADEGNIRNNRYKALLLVAAEVALHMKLTLDNIEKALPLHFQRMLVDGVVDFAESTQPRNAFTKEINLEPCEAHLLHNRWTLRAIVNQSQNGYLTSSNRHEAEELMSNYQMALGDLTGNHAQIAQNVQAILANDNNSSLTRQNQLDAFYDLSLYYFTFHTYEKAYECFSRAAELLEDYQGQVTLLQEQRGNLEGYLAACEAMLESRSMTEGQMKSVRAQIEMAWEFKDWERIITLLQNDLVTDELHRLPNGFRAALEQQALRLVRTSEGDATDEEKAIMRFYHKRIVIGNAIFQLLHGNDEDDLIATENCICCCFCILQDEIFQSVSCQESAEQSSQQQNLFIELIHFICRLCGFLFKNVTEKQQSRLQSTLVQLKLMLPCITSLDGVQKILQLYEVHEDEVVVLPFGKKHVDEILAVESQLQKGIEQQRAHFRLASDLGGLFTFANAHAKEVFISSLQKEAMTENENTLALDARDVLQRWKNVITFCLLNNCWDVLLHYKAAAPKPSLLALHVEFALSCGALMELLSTSISSSIAGESNSDNGKSEFAIGQSNKIMADILFKCREIVDLANTDKKVTSTEVNAGDVAMNELLIDLPLWILETLVCVCAGLLHRAYMRNICDYRISFDLTPYGDLALLQAFAPEAPKKTAIKTEGEQKEASETAVMTVAFVKSFQGDLVALHRVGLDCLLRRCGREPRWHCAKADLYLNPIVKQKLSSTSDPHAALKGYLVAASLATNFFSDMTSVVDIIDQSSLVRLSHCLVKVGAHVAAAVLYQCFAREEIKYGLRILQLAPETHDDAFFQYFWELPFLELLVHLHSNPKHYNNSHIILLTHLIQSPELNSSNPIPVLKEVEQRILRCYFRDLCRIYLQ